MLVVLKFVVVLVRVHQMKSQMRADMHGNTSARLAELMRSVRLQWGYLPQLVAL